MLTYTPNIMGINYNSPTVQNLQQGGMGQQLPYSTTPNIGAIGYNTGGYMNPPNYNNLMNGGYYSGYYNYYNPQAIRQQIEEQRKAEEQALRNSIEFKKAQARAYNNYHGIETDEEYLEKLYNPNTYAELQKDEQDFYNMARLSQISNDPANQPNTIAQANAYYRISSEIRSKHPVDQSFTDFMNTASDLYYEAVMNEKIRESRRNIVNMYDSNAYSQLTNMHRQSSFASLRQAVSVDDLSISLPEHLKRSSSYQERKQQFLNHIMNDPRNRGGY